MTPDSPIDVSVVIPAWREEARIRRSIEEALSCFDSLGLRAEVIVSEDGGDDDTAAEVLRAASLDPRARLVRLGVHRGKGAAVRAGVAASTGSMVLLIDADFAIPLSEFPAFRDALAAGADAVIASKELGRRRGLVRQPPLRVLMGRVFNLLVRAIVLPGFLDTQAGFKLLDGPVARALFAECVIDGFAYDVEMLAIARARGLRVVELPVHCCLSAGTRVKVLRDSLRMLRDSFRIRARVRRLRRHARPPHA